MLRFIKNTVFFIILCGVFYIVALVIWNKFMSSKLKPNMLYYIGAYGHAHTRFQEVKQTKDIDILFIGSSHAYRGFDTEFFNQAGYQSFNLGTSSQSPIQSEALLKRYLDTLKPKAVVFEVFPEVFCLDGIESTLDLIANDQLDQFTFEMASKTWNTKVFNTLIYGSIAKTFGFYSDFKEPRVKDIDEYVTGGYVRKNKFENTASPTQAETLIAHEKQLHAFESMISILQSRNIPLILVYAPITENFYNKVSYNLNFDSLYKQTALPYFNFNQLLELVDSLHFYDEHHLNPNGVQIFNNALLDTLTQNQLIVSHGS